MLLEKYEPSSSRELLGNEKQIDEIRLFLKKKKGAIFLHGPTGSGKTLAVKLLAKELDYEVLESTASDRSVSEILKSSKQSSLYMKRKLILVDETNLLSERGLMELIKNSSFPIVFVGIDAYRRGLRNIRSCCKLVKFNRVRYDVIAKFLIDICKKEGIVYEEPAVKQIARMCNGDIRSSLIDLDILKPKIDMDSIKRLGFREKEDNIFNTLKILFSSKELKNSKIALNSCEKPPEELFLWLEENVQSYRNIEEIALAYDYLSKADIFASRIIKRQAWTLQKYLLDLSVSGLVLNKGFVFSYQFPRFLKKNKITIDENIAKNLHISRKEAREAFPLLSLLVKKDPSLANKLGINPEELKT
jgi:replication factor C large subunit